MRVLKIHDLPENPMDSATPIAGWKGERSAERGKRLSATDNPTTFAATW